MELCLIAFRLFQILSKVVLFQGIINVKATLLFSLVKTLVDFLSIFRHSLKSITVLVYLIVFYPSHVLHHLTFKVVCIFILIYFRVLIFLSVLVCLFDFSLELLDLKEIVHL